MPIGIEFVKVLLGEDFNSVYEQRKSDDEAWFIIPFSGYQVVLRVNNKRNFISARVPGIAQLTNEYKAKVLEKAMELNYTMILGSYSYDPDDGELSFEATIPTDDFQEPWESYKALVKRIISVAMFTGSKDGQAPREMSYTGKWSESEEKPAQADVYKALVIPIKTGIMSAKDIATEKRDELLDLLLKHSIEPGVDKVEDYPPEWQALIRERMGGGSGTEI